MNLYEFADFRAFLQAWLRTQPKGGRGIIRAWAEAFRVHPTLLSQILSGKRSLSLELAEPIAEKIGLSDSETDYFFLLVQANQAGTERLRQKLLKRVQAAQEKARQIGSRVGETTRISESKNAEFYSAWLYAGVRNLTAVEEFQSVEAIAAHLGLPKMLVGRVVDFLLEAGLCVRKKGRLAVGPQRTHIGQDSPLVAKHHQNWRLHGFSQMLLKKEDDVFLTIPMSLSEADAKKLRALVPQWAKDVAEIVGPSKSETVRCLNIDFFAY